MVLQLMIPYRYGERIGKRSALVGSGTGPASYVTGGDPISLSEFNWYVDWLANSVSLDGTYEICPVPATAGQPRAGWKAIWFVKSTGAQVAPGVNLSAETVQLGGFGGQY